MTAPRNRVRGIAELPAARVENSPGNWRTHDAAQKDKMRGLLGEVGSVSELVVWIPDDEAREALRRLPGPDGFAAWLATFTGKVRLLDGHMRKVLRGKRLGVQITDLDAREAALVLATFDPIGAQAGRDDKLLRELLDGQRSEHRGLEALLADLRASLGDAPAGSGSREGPAGDEPILVEVEDLPAPFPRFGGKRPAAPIIWGAFGNVANYVEPFFGTGAVLLARPGYDGSQTETVNDKDCYLANFWRAVGWPDSIEGERRIEAVAEEVARWADWPVNEVDLHARHLWLVTQAEFRERMMRDPEFFDAKIAGLWVWGACGWIGSGWCDERWHGGASGAAEAPRECGDGDPMPSRQLPHLGDAGMGIHRKLPHLGDAGRGEYVYQIFRALRARLRRVRVACGGWERVTGESVTFRHGLTGVFLDPPYKDGAGDLYSDHDKSLSATVRAWAIDNGDNPMMRIALCGYEGEHEMPRTWRVIHWKARGGYGSQREDGSNENAGRERIWLSPHCLRPEAP